MAGVGNPPVTTSQSQTESRRQSNNPAVSRRTSAHNSPLQQSNRSLGHFKEEEEEDSNYDTQSLAGTNVDTELGGLSTPGGDNLSLFGGNGSILGLGAAVGGRVDLGNLNIVSWKKQVEIDSGEAGEGSVAGDEGDEGKRRRRRPFNAISTVLSHPSKPPAPLRSSRKPLPPTAFPSPPGPVVLPKPPPPGFYQPYLDGVQGLWGEWERLQERERRKGKGKGREVVEVEDLQAEERKKEVALPDLADIPTYFFDSGFDLANPLTWEHVMSSPTPSSSKSPNHLPPPEIQHSLSSHLDDLESHLVHEISIRTPSFFSALSNLQSLNSQTSSCLSRISALRTQLADLDERQAIKGLRIINTYEKLRRSKSLRTAVGEVDAVRSAGRLAKELGDAGDWVGALEGMEAVGKWWRQYGGEQANGRIEAEPGLAATLNGKTTGQVLPLATLESLKSIPSDLSTLSQQIATQLEASLSSLVMSVIGATSNSLAPSRATSPAPQSGGNVDAEAQHQQSRIEFRHQSHSLLIGMARCDARGSALRVWKNCVSKVVKEGMRQHLQIDHEGEDDHEENKGQSLADILRDMSNERFLMLSTKMYATMKTRIELIRVLGEELSDMLQSEEFLSPQSLAGVGRPSSESSRTPFSGEQIAAEIKDTLVSACELANARAAKVLVARTPQHADLTLDEFVAIFEETWAFVVACEAISGRMIVSLRGVITSQARAFLVKYHAIRLQASAKCVEEEQWVQIDVPLSTQRCVDTIIASAISDMPEHRLATKSEPQSNGHPPSANGDNLGKVLKVEDNSFFIVSATAKTVEMLNDYQRLMVNLELVATDVMNRVIEFLKSFNSRTCQVVLGAGAMRSAGLKNITAKHLALASQSLSIIVCLIPYMREFVRRHLNPKQAVMLVEFDKLKRDFQEHQNEIHAKLVAIMADRLAVHCSSLRAIDWEATPTKAGPNAYAELLVKETSTLHKVLSKYLSSQAVYFVMHQVVSAVNTKFGDLYSKVEFKSDDAKKRMEQDVTFLVNRLKELTDPSAESPIAPLEKLVKDKPTPKKQMSATINGLLRRGNKDTPDASKGGSSTPSKADEQVQEAQRQASEDALTAIGDIDTPDPTDGSKERYPILETQLEEGEVDKVEHGTAVLTAEPEAIDALPPPSSVAAVEEEPQLSEDKVERVAADMVDALPPASDNDITNEALASVDKEVDALLDEAADDGVVPPAKAIEEGAVVHDVADDAHNAENGGLPKLVEGE